mmetsp:Transcript_21683/g.37223  ORF Transcript_21683/g.37223 Transcript_21683/m.37223 type:complete len:83 (+) Transcript_21683:240-488(+)
MGLAVGLEVDGLGATVLALVVSVDTVGVNPGVATSVGSGVVIGLGTVLDGTVLDGGAGRSPTIVGAGVTGVVGSGVSPVVGA